MSDVVVSVIESTTNVTVTEQDVAVAVTETSVDVSSSTAGIQGASYNQGDPIYVTVRNSTGATLSLGTIVYTSGGNGTHTQVSPALATSDATSARVLGWLAESIANNASGLCQVEGYLDGINTQGITEGTQLYLSGTTAGAFQTSKPQAPIHLVYVGVAVKASAGNGRVYVKVQNGYELDEIHDVQITGLADGDLLRYESSTDLWKNKAASTLTLAQSQITNLVSDLAGKANLAGGNALTGAQTVTASTATQVPLTLVAASGQTANLQTWTDSTSAILARITSTGVIETNQYLNMATSANAGIAVGGIYRIRMTGGASQMESSGAANVVAIVKGAASQTADLLQLQNSGGTVLTKVDKNGAVSATYFGPSGTGLLGYLDWTGSSPLFQTGGASVVGIRVRGAASQTADLTQWQDSAGSVKTYIDSNGRVQSYTAGNFGGLSAGLAFLGVQTQASTVGLLVRGAASQTANLQEWQNSAGVIQSSIDPSGQLRAPAWLNNNSFNNSRVRLLDTGTVVDTGVAANVPLIVATTNASPTGNLTEWKNSAGTILTKVGNTGDFYAPALRTTNDYVVAGQTANGGTIRMQKADSASAPPSNQVRLMVLAGTNANTLKLVAIGPNGTPVTILDNLG